MTETSESGTGKERFLAPCVPSVEYSHSTKILMFLRRGETNQQMISTSLREDPGTVARELRRLRQEGMVTMRKDTMGEYEYSLNIYALTPKGRVIGDAATLVWKVQNGMLGEQALEDADAMLVSIIGEFDIGDAYPEPEKKSKRRRRRRRFMTRSSSPWDGGGPPFLSLTRMNGSTYSYLAPRVFPTFLITPASISADSLDLNVWSLMSPTQPWMSLRVNDRCLRALRSIVPVRPSTFEEMSMGARVRSASSSADMQQSMVTDAIRLGFPDSRNSRRAHSMGMRAATRCFARDVRPMPRRFHDLNAITRSSPLNMVLSPWKGWRSSMVFQKRDSAITGWYADSFIVRTTSARVTSA